MFLQLENHKRRRSLALRRVLKFPEILLKYPWIALIGQLCSDGNMTPVGCNNPDNLKDFWRARVNAALWSHHFKGYEADVDTPETSTSYVDRPGIPASCVDTPGTPASYVDRPGTPAPNHVDRPGTPAPNHVDRPGTPAPNHVDRPGTPASFAVGYHKTRDTTQATTQTEEMVLKSVLDIIDDDITPKEGEFAQKKSNTEDTLGGDGEQDVTKDALNEAIIDCDEEQELAMEASGDSEIDDDDSKNGEDDSDQENAGDDETEEEDDIENSDGLEKDDFPGCIHENDEYDEALNIRAYFNGVFIGILIYIGIMILAIRCQMWFSELAEEVFEDNQEDRFEEL
eukprot:TRINITY_DN12649_c0_g1_i17.p1 TRINITY_DN12649_c0_g1~~TRINITY_DN12649_c0_g1_i17.p1  ORF type:complete len:341 (-),score=105.08 TRINITY_DN12649_c0_g1_i17:156-1178(-)